MPVVFTFDLNESTPGKYRTYIQSAFTRLGWERLGGTSYRYPKLGTDDQPTEDWLNHVVPALALFRAMVIKHDLGPAKYSLDVQSSTGFNPGTHGSSPKTANKSDFYEPENDSFGKRKLEEFINKIEFPY